MARPRSPRGSGLASTAHLGPVRMTAEERRHIVEKCASRGLSVSAAIRMLPILLEFLAAEK